MAVDARAAQEFVPVKDIQNGVIIMRDGSLRGVLMASSLNFALKSTDEQQSIIFQFQNFLNSLDFSVQIMVQSKRLDIRPYLNLLEGRYKEQMNDLMKIQIREYIEFVRTFTESVSIMSKTFFVVVPFSPSILTTKKGPFGGIGRKKTVEETAMSFEESRLQLEQRIGVVEQGLNRSGVKSVQLGTEEIIELLYKTFNPGDTEKPIPMQ